MIRPYYIDKSGNKVYVNSYIAKPSDSLIEETVNEYVKDHDVLSSKQDKQVIYTTSTERENTFDSTYDLETCTVYGKSYATSGGVYGFNNSINIYKNCTPIVYNEHMWGDSGSHNGLTYKVNVDRSIIVNGSVESGSSLWPLSPRNPYALPEFLSPGDTVYFDYCSNVAYPCNLIRFLISWRTEDNTVIQSDWIDLYNMTWTTSNTHTVIVPENAAKWYVSMYMQTLSRDGNKTVMSLNDFVIFPVIAKWNENSEKVVVPFADTITANDETEDYAVINKNSVVVHKKNELLVFDGTEGWTITDGKPTLTSVTEYKSATCTTNILSAHTSGENIIIDVEEYDDVESWKTYLASNNMYCVASTAEESTTTYETTSDLTESSGIATFMLENNSSYYVDLIKYIDDHQSNVVMTYTTPEDFGATGDGYADDYKAVASCVAYAIKNGLKIFALKSYNIYASTIEITSGVKAEFGTLIYSGTDSAITVTGSNNTLYVDSISSGGTGITLSTSNGGYITYNTINVGTITSSKSGIDIISVNGPIYQNKIEFKHIKAGGDGVNCINVTNADGQYVCENTITGGHCENADWAYYSTDNTVEKVSPNLQMKLYNIQAEGVKGGFVLDGQHVITDPRVIEISFSAEYLTTFKFKGLTANSRIDYNVLIPVNTIDVSENNDTKAHATYGTVSLSENNAQLMNIPLTGCAYNKSMGNPFVITKQFYVWGKYLIFIPYADYDYTVNSSELDIRGTDVFNMESPTIVRLPTKFIVATDTAIKLHASYCSFGYRKFRIVQKDGHKATVYNVHDNVIFNGVDYEDGTYELECHAFSENSSGEQAYYVWIDGSGEEWGVSEIN